MGRDAAASGVLGGSAADLADDAALLARFAAGDAAAAETLSARHAPALYALAARMLGDPTEAEDVVQEAFLRAWRAADEWRADAPVGVWLRKVAVNLCLDRLRKSARAAPLEAAPEPQDPAPSALARLTAAERAEIVRGAFARLPERQRAAVTLRHFDGLGNPEIAEILGVGVEAVESLLARGRRTLRALVAAAEAPGGGPGRKTSETKE